MIFGDDDTMIFGRPEHDSDPMTIWGRDLTSQNDPDLTSSDGLANPPKKRVQICTQSTLKMLARSSWVHGYAGYTP